MKRSFINRKIKQAIGLLEDMNFYLPPFAFWSGQKWKDIMKSPQLRKKYGNIIERGLGWDITDRGLGMFNEIGLLLFTLRNGKSNTHRDYAEKILLIQEQQVTPWHYHWKKCEDIINRGGGVLIIEVNNSTANDIGPYDDWMPGKFGTTDVPIIINGMLKEVSAGSLLELGPGESVTVFPGVYHKFYGKKDEGMILTGEVSKVNDDYYDSRFKEKLTRFPEIDEDEPREFVLCNEYESLIPLR